MLLFNELSMLKGVVAIASRKEKWRNEKKVGIFMHYGLYSQIERGECTIPYDYIPYKGCTKLADIFNPSHFDAERLVCQAKDAGVGYLVLTTRHHGVFCLYDSQYSDYNAAKYVGRDLIREYSNQSSPSKPPAATRGSRTPPLRLPII